MHVGSAEAEGFPGLVGEHPAVVALVENPLPVRTAGDGVKRVIVVPAVESGQENLLRVAIRLAEFPVAVPIGELEQMGRLGNHHHIIEDADPERCDQLRILPENG